jgi:hypothetical protein
VVVDSPGDSNRRYIVDRVAIRMQPRIWETISAVKTPVATGHFGGFASDVSSVLDHRIMADFYVVRDFRFDMVTMLGLRGIQNGHEFANDGGASGYVESAGRRCLRKCVRHDASRLNTATRVSKTPEQRSGSWFSLPLDFTGMHRQNGMLCTAPVHFDEHRRRWQVADVEKS